MRSDQGVEGVVEGGAAVVAERTAEIITAVAAVLQLRVDETSDRPLADRGVDGHAQLGQKGGHGGRPATGVAHDVVIGGHQHRQAGRLCEEQTGVPHPQGDTELGRNVVPLLERAGHVDRVAEDDDPGHRPAHGPTPVGEGDTGPWVLPDPGLDRMDPVEGGPRHLCGEGGTAVQPSGQFVRGGRVPPRMSGFGQEPVVEHVHRPALPVAFGVGPGPHHEIAGRRWGRGRAGSSTRWRPRYHCGACQGR